MKRPGFAGFVLLGVLFSMLTTYTDGQTALPANETRLVSADSDFCFRLIKELSSEQPRANLFVSPFSISSVLQMLSNGARGRTQQELKQVLGTSDLEIGEMNRAYESLGQAIKNDRTNEVLRLANALWYRKGAQIQPEFGEVNKQCYGAELEALDFADPASAGVMNDWAARSTQGRIKTIIQPPLAPDTAMIIANAIYFKGTWLSPFDSKQTKPRSFHLGTGGDKQTPMMAQTRSFEYLQTPDFQAVQLAYSGNRLEMEVLLPATNSTVDALVGKLNAQFWQQTVLRGFHSSRGTLVLPKFRMRYSTELNKPLSVLGLKSAWSSQADFSGISSSPLFVSQIRHQSFVDVNEEGTEAAAVTTGVMALASFRNQPPPFEMIVDRPFLFVISDRTTQCILFVGAVYDPGSSDD